MARVRTGMAVLAAASSVASSAHAQNTGRTPGLPGFEQHQASAQTQALLDVPSPNILTCPASSVRFIDGDTLAVCGLTITLANANGPELNNAACEAEAEAARFMAPVLNESIWQSEQDRIAACEQASADEIAPAIAPFNAKEACATRFHTRVSGVGAIGLNSVDLKGTVRVTMNPPPEFALELAPETGLDTRDFDIGEWLVDIGFAVAPDALPPWCDQ